MTRTIGRSARTIAAAEAVVVRRATTADTRQLLRLAALDSRPPLEGELVVAEVEGEVRAARALRDGRAVSDPFAPTAALLELLAMRAGQLTRSGPAPRARIPFLARRLRGAL